MLSWLLRQIRRYLQTFRLWLSRHALGLSITVLVAAFLVVFLWQRIFISIHSGHVGVLWRRFGGTVTARVYGEGLHIISPLDIMYPYSVRWHVLRRQVAALAQDGLEIGMDLGLLYRVDRLLAAELHQDVGPAYVESLIVPTLDAAARNMLGRLHVERIYVNREQDVNVDVFERNLIEQAKQEVGWKFIEVHDISVLRLILPERIQNAIQQKREEEQFALLYDFRLAREQKEAERKRIEAQGIRDFQDTISGGLTDRYLTFKGIEASLELARSPNAKIIVFGDEKGLPLVLGNVPFDIQQQQRGPVNPSE